jgi:hypothetical protein
LRDFHAEPQALGHGEYADNHGKRLVEGLGIDFLLKSFSPLLALGGADVEVVNVFPGFSDGPDAFSTLGLGAWF